MTMPLDANRLMIEAHEQRKWVKFDETDPKTYPREGSMVICATKRGNEIRQFYKHKVDEFNVGTWSDGKSEVSAWRTFEEVCYV